MPATRTRSFVLALTLAAAASATAAPALAQTEAALSPEAQRASAHYDTGEQAYTEGRYEDAVAEFDAAYQLSPQPVLLYNLANAYERLGRYPEAVDALTRFLPSAPIEERAQLQTRIVNLQRRTRRRRPLELMTPGVILAAAGGAVIVAGAIFGGLALDGSATEGEDCMRGGDGRLLCRGEAGGGSDASTFALIADIGLFGGAAIAVTGVALILVHVLSQSSSEDTQTAQLLLPSLDVRPDGATFGLVGGF